MTMPPRLLGLLLQVFRRLPQRLRIAVVHLVGPSYSVGTVCVIERADGALLLCRHSYKQRWGFPGGLLNRGEEADHGARREALEEVGLDIELLGEPHVVIEPHERRVDVIYRARPAAGVDPSRARPHPPEIVACEWFAPGELPPLQAEAAGALVALARAGDDHRR